MTSLISKLRKIKNGFLGYSPLIVVKISSSRLIGNLREYQMAHPDLLIAPVLKSNAYGHGLLLVAEILDSEDVPFFVLDSLFEARVLRRHGIKTKILVIGYTPVESILRKNNSDISFTVPSLDQLKELSEKIKYPIHIHIKIDTGMHRQGLAMDEVSASINVLKENNKLKLEGICSHFADADSDNTKYTLNQNREWLQIVDIFLNVFPEIPFVHISSTAGARYDKNTSSNMLRLGLGLYGIDPSPVKKHDVKPVLQMESCVSSLRELTVGDRIGYNGTHIVERASLIATVPVGYFEGVDRRLSNRGVFKIGNVFCTIVGRVSMNITSVDVCGVLDIKRSDNVVIISNNSDDPNSVSSIAKITETIPWEILVHIPAHLYRKVVD